MGKIVKKYYKGYEDKNEIQIVKRKGEKEELTLKIWAESFNNIMYSIKPREKTWKGLGYYYYLCDGWYKKSPFKLENLNEVLNELKEIKINDLNEKEIYLLNDITNIIKGAIEEEKDIFIVYDRKNEIK